MSIPAELKAALQSGPLGGGVFASHGLCNTLCAPLRTARLSNPSTVTDHGKLVRVCGAADGAVKSVILFEAPYPVGTPGNIGMLVEFAEVADNQTWAPSDAYPLSRDTFGATLDIFKLASLSKPTLWYSSCDFVELLAFEAELAFRGWRDEPMKALVDRLERESGLALKGLGRFRAGVNFRGRSAVNQLLDPLREAVRNTGILGNTTIPNLPDANLCGAIGLTPQGLFLEVGTEVNFGVQLLDGRLAIELARVWVRGDRLGLDTPQVSMGLAGSIKAASNTMAVDLSLSAGAHAIVLEAVTRKKPSGVPAGDQQERGWIATLLGQEAGHLANAEGHYKKIIDKAHDYLPTIKRLNASIPLRDGARPQLAILLGYHQPFSFSGVSIKVDPALSIVTDFSSTTLTFSGRCDFAGTAFDVIVNPGQRQLIATMANGTSVDIARFLDTVGLTLPGNHSLKIINVDLDINLAKKTLLFHVLSIGFLEFTVGTTPLRIGQVELQIEKDEHLCARLGGVIGIGDHMAAIDAEYEGGAFSFRCVVPSINIAQIGRDLFGKNVDMPPALRDARVTDLRLGLTIGDRRTEFQFSARSNATIPVGGLKIGLHGLDVDYFGGALSVWGKAALVISDDVVVDLELGYKGGQGEKCWFLKSGAAKPIGLRPLLNNIAAAFEAKDQFCLSRDVEVTPEVYLEFGTDATRLAFVCKMGTGASEVTLAIVVRKSRQEGQKPDEKSGWQVVVSMTAPKLDLSGLPLIGPAAQAAGGLALADTQLRYASTDIGAGSPLFSPAHHKNFRFPHVAAPLPKGVSYATTLRLGQPEALLFEQRLAYPEDKAREKKKPDDPKESGQIKKENAPDSLGDVGQAGENDKKKSPRLIQIERIRYDWNDGKIGILIDGGVELAGFKFDLIGLAARIPPTALLSVRPTLDAQAVRRQMEELSKYVEFGLDGLALDVKRGPVSITGALLKKASATIGPAEYSGMAAIRTASFGVSAYGSYTQINGQPSVLIYGAYLGLIGGPPAFMVTGVAAGFGYNRALAVPSIDKVGNVPLVQAAMGKSNNIDSTDPKFFPPAGGQYWVAAGVRFTSFKLIDAAVLATVQFGARSEVTLLGMAMFQQPLFQPAVQAELALKARFAPEDGGLTVQAQLTDKSFLFHESCKLTGGFAFCVWFNPSKHAGDFVITLGGYHPKFTPPPHYPLVPRVGLRWVLPGAGVTIEGGVYFALTPSMIMAGGRLSAVYKSERVHAWFVAYADFLAAWEPFHYEAVIDIRVGCRVTVTVLGWPSTYAFEIGARLHIDGPPFAGEAFIDVGVMTFTVPIGEKTRSKIASRLAWKQFVEKFVPLKKDERKPDDHTLWKVHPIGITILNGVMERHKTGDGEIIVVIPADLRLSIISAIPATTLKIRGSVQTVEKAANTRLGIRPMNIRALDSTISVTASMINGRDYAVPLVFHATTASPPEALWSPVPFDKNDLTAKPVGEAITGIMARPARSDVGRTTKPVELNWNVITRSVAPPRHAYTTATTSAAKLEKPKMLAGLASTGFTFPNPDQLGPGELLKVLRGTPQSIPMGCVRPISGP